MGVWLSAGEVSKAALMPKLDTDYGLRRKGLLVSFVSFISLGNGHGSGSIFAFSRLIFFPAYSYFPLRSELSHCFRILYMISLMRNPICFLDSYIVVL